MTTMHYTWRGRPIRDVRAWAHGRGKALIRFHAERTVPNLLTGTLDIETEDGEMPESFWNGLRETDGWHYTETGRDLP